MRIIPPPRTTDSWGSGAFGAPRGNRTHRGIDIACYKGSRLVSQINGQVTKIGYPYDPGKHPEKGYLRYIQITTPDGKDHRFFYVSTDKKPGDTVSRGEIFGVAQGLLDVYPGITDHIHYEIKVDGEFINPESYLVENIYD